MEGERRCKVVLKIFGKFDDLTMIFHQLKTMEVRMVKQLDMLQTSSSRFL